MKFKIFIVAISLFLLEAGDCFGQKMYAEGESIYLDLGPETGFPQNFSTTTSKIVTGTPVYNQIWDQNWEVTNRTLFQKLEIDKEDRTSGWASGIQYCSSKGNGWRPPTIGELTVIYQFADALDALGAPLTLGRSYASQTEGSQTTFYYLTFNAMPTISDAIKTVGGMFSRCVREVTD